MKISFKSNKKLFLIYLLINASGYYYENNPNGMHPLRKYFVDKFLMLGNERVIRSSLIAYIKNLPLVTDEYIRVANSVMGEDSFDLSDMFFEKFNELLLSVGINHLFDEYVREIENYNQNNFVQQEVRRVLNFLQPKIDNNKNIFIHLNLLESYSRGSNYYNERYISVSLDIDDKISDRSLRHELIHILLKDITVNTELNFSDLDIPVSSNYEIDDQRARFDENFVIAATLCFENEKIQQKNLKFFDELGFTKLKIFFEFLNQKIYKDGEELSIDLIAQLISFLTNGN